MIGDIQVAFLALADDFASLVGDAIVLPWGRAIDKING
jgi:hypothetical protein